MKEVLINRVYKNYKGDYYIVVDIAINSENLEKMVCYRGLYEDGPLWVRPYSEFIEEVDHKKYPQYDQKYKFELQEIESKRQ